MDPSPSSPIGSGATPPAAGPEAGPAAAAVDDAGPAPASASAPAGDAASVQAPAPAAAARRPPRRIGPVPLDRRTGAIAGGVAALFLLFAWAGTGYSYQPYVDRPPRFEGKPPATDRELRQASTRLERRSRDLAAKLKATAPRGVYIVIDQTQNRLYLKKDEETLLEARCSAGSGMILKESTGKKREWVFDSPRGRFEVLSMSRNPVWAKPDWAFVEEGEPIPTNPADRFESGSLGEYALNFGNGYMIHGTLYERLLGRAVSHGCIRVGRDDLRKVWANAHIGTRIFIY